MSTSVAVRNRKSGKYYVFCKGSYERMQQLSTPGSVPADYKSVVDRLAMDGCYVLGLSYRELLSDWTHKQRYPDGHDHGRQRHNWVVGPFVMILLAAGFFHNDTGFMAGFSLVGCSRCIGMEATSSMEQLSSL
ncbi:P-type ATPase (P-ATPase) Superfamily [Phytophthora palmivora]|uniref:P-type ATPase (P-ATPase) Superfamily n=1 Tax=Phytophthora palmivora TaxID=4796 RepID=A0A2P4YIJ4_9STRA|nr:P-type ATPase (P-ATPase) Superfamily [Phytophthora palmivora]